MQYVETPPGHAFTAEAFRDLARRALGSASPCATGGPRPRGPSDFDLDPEPGPELASALKPAAVLVPIVARPELTLLFTQRTDQLPAHAGQIAFPGGKIEQGDESPLATALREAKEEIGLDPAFVEPLGILDEYRTGTGYCITPVVALVDPGFTLALNKEEVVDAFEVPLPFLMNPRNHQTHVRTLGARERRFYAMAYGERFIWGATAGILRNMHERLFTS
jgi:8-oxo-dGTP pyrophosphatase MutT (NUDIX family)